MPFIVIEGTYHLVGASRTGRRTGFQPDGGQVATALRETWPTR